MLLLVTVVALVTAQVVVVRRHLYVVGNTGRRRQSTVDLGKVVRESKAPQVPAAEVSGSEDGAAAPFDPAVFSQFRAHLDAAEGDTQGSLTPPSGAGAAADDANMGGAPAQPPVVNKVQSEDGDVRVVLSPAARSKAAAARSPSQHPLPPEGGGAPPILASSAAAPLLCRLLTNFKINGIGMKVQFPPAAELADEEDSHP